MLIDFHTHTQPDLAHAKEFFGWIGRQPRNLGTIDEVFEKMAQVGVARTLIVPWLPSHDLVRERELTGEPRASAVRAVLDQWRKLNAWGARAASETPARISSLVGVDPILMTPAEIETEVEARLTGGACGLKIAPTFLDAPPSDPRFEIVWRLARRHGVFVLSETCSHETHGHQPWGHPRNFEPVFSAYPDVRIVLAHLGNGAEEEVVRLARLYPGVYTDISLCLTDIDGPDGFTSAEMVDLIRRIGVDRVIYGTNYPIVDVQQYARTFAALDLSQDERDQIAWRNAEGLLISAMARADPG